MNERIEQLAEEAGIAIWGDAVYMYHPTDTLDSAVLEKFAELIVKECNEVLRLVPYNSNVEFGDEVIYQDAIKKHFGVEE